MQVEALQEANFESENITQKTLWSRTYSKLDDEENHKSVLTVKSKLSKEEPQW